LSIGLGVKGSSQGNVAAPEPQALRKSLLGRQAIPFGPFRRTNVFHVDHAGTPRLSDQPFYIIADHVRNAQDLKALLILCDIHRRPSCKIVRRLMATPGELVDPGFFT
jgi:hypothetical protein